MSRMEGNVAEECRQALIVEDDEDIRDLLSTLLTVLGFEVREANNGQVGLEALRSGWKPDLIVLDLMMPVMNGWAFRAEQRKIDGLREVPVIVLSARRPRVDRGTRSSAARGTRPRRSP